MATEGSERERFERQEALTLHNSGKGGEPAWPGYVRISGGAGLSLAGLTLE